VPGQLVRPDQPLAIGLASTIHAADGEVVDALRAPGDLAEWLRVHADRLDVPGAVPARAALADVRRLRDAVQRLFRAAVDRADPDAADADALNDAAAAAPSHVELRWRSRRRPPVAARVGPADPTTALLGALAADAIDVLAGAHGELRACQGPSCVLFFVRSHPRQAWCSPGCGNRARVARHYRRTKAQGVGTD
jgi:predicted RNA-binding Zn ribbon-like protein